MLKKPFGLIPHFEKLRKARAPEEAALKMALAQKRVL